MRGLAKPIRLWFYFTSAFEGVIAQLVERLNGIEEVWGSNPHGSISLSNGSTRLICQ